MSARLTKVVALAGGVGGAKLADGLAQVLSPQELTIIVNTGDDFEHLGLYICPDLDTVCYTLAGIANPATGWGRLGETWGALETLGQLSGPTWFRLGDHDLGLHLERTRRKRSGQPLSQITEHICQALGVKPRVLPMSDDVTPTWVDTDEGELPFQEYFVHRQCHPRVTGFRFQDIECARPAPGVLESLEAADLVVICPSNPWVSIGPILALSGVRQVIERRPTAAVSPIIGGQAVKGPAAKMYAELGIQPSALSVARHYQNLLSGFVLDRLDEQQVDDIHLLGMRTLVTDTLMRTPLERARLGKEVIDFGLRLLVKPCEPT
ncbi:MAG: 2-phospho-L-lactate transferase [Anaerolineales bacterium]|nr:2-phospho-L-lactate transferase [Anaerolineales bacterium]